MVDARTLESLHAEETYYAEQLKLLDNITWLQEVTYRCIHLVLMLGVAALTCGSPSRVVRCATHSMQRNRLFSLLRNGFYFLMRALGTKFDEIVRLQSSLHASSRLMQ